MATTITEITECFEYFFSSLYRREFVKTLRLNECSERELLPLVRCYLLGWFADNVSPEVKSKLPGTVSGHGYIDFVIDCAELLPPELVIHRLTGDGPKSLLIAPSWSGNKRLVLNTLARRFKERNTWQGRLSG